MEHMQVQQILIDHLRTSKNDFEQLFGSKKVQTFPCGQKQRRGSLYTRENKFPDSKEPAMVAEWLRASVSNSSRGTSPLSQS